MEERKMQTNEEWYAPATQAEADVTDLFEEVGMYRIKSREELYARNTPKKRKWVPVVAVITAIALLIAAIVVSAKIFAEEDDHVAAAKDFFDAYSEFYDQYEKEEVVSGECLIPSAGTNPDLELKLESSAGLEALTLQELYAKCSPSIVGINTYADGSPLGWGTGVVMTADGYIITNAHVVGSAEAAEVIMHDGKIYEAKLVGTDAISDIALLKVEAKGLAAASFCDSDLVQVGDEAIAIGNPLGEQFSGTMTTGIISGVSRNVDYKNRTMSLLQTNAALNSGNSGGALFNIYGQVVGITNMKMMGSFTSTIEGVGFAIPSATVKEMVDAILDDGAVVGRPAMGITVYDLSDLGNLNYEDPSYPEDGMLVNSVAEGSDAEKQGLQVEDVIVEIDGKKAEDIQVVRGVINKKQVGDTVTVKVWRAGETITLKFKLIDQNDF